MTDKIVIWSNALADAVQALHHDPGQTADVQSRAREIWNGCRVGTQLKGHHFDFISAFRQRLEKSDASRAFEAAWGKAWNKGPF